MSKLAALGLTGSALVFALAQPAQARRLTVGPGKAYAAPCAASAAAQAGDTVEIDPGVYSGDVCAWTANNLVIRATSAYAHLDANGANSRGKGIWVIDGNDVLVVRDHVAAAAERARSGGGPTVLEARTYRHFGHSRTDPAK